MSAIVAGKDAQLIEQWDAMDINKDFKLSKDSLEVYLMRPVTDNKFTVVARRKHLEELVSLMPLKKPFKSKLQPPSEQEAVNKPPLNSYSNCVH